MRAVWLATAAFLTLAAPAAAGEYHNSEMSVSLPGKWAIDTYDYKYRVPTVTFAWNADDYPRAVFYHLASDYHLADPAAILAHAAALGGQEPAAGGDDAGTLTVTRDAPLRRHGLLARRIDFTQKAHGDSYNHSVVVIDPGGRKLRQLLVLDVFYFFDNSPAERNCGAQTCTAAEIETMRQTTEAMLASFAAAGPARPK